MVNVREQVGHRDWSPGRFLVSCVACCVYCAGVIFSTPFIPTVATFTSAAKLKRCVSCTTVFVVVFFHSQCSLFSLFALSPALISALLFQLHLIFLPFLLTSSFLISITNVPSLTSSKILHSESPSAHSLPPNAFFGLYPKYSCTQKSGLYVCFVSALDQCVPI